MNLPYVHSRIFPNYYHLVSPKKIPDNFNLDRPLNLLFLTSIRDVGVNSDKNGEFVCGRDKQKKYMMGLPEATVRCINAQNSVFSSLFRVVGIVFDDNPREIGESYLLQGENNRHWIYPLQLKDESSKSSLEDLTYHVPSTFRLLPFSRACAKVS